jgi:hypothetical protein
MTSGLFRSFALALLISTAHLTSTAYAVSYQPPFHLFPESNAVVVRGGIVYMFHSGTRDITSTVHKGDIFVIYRTGSSCRLEEVGKVRFINFAGETYMKAEVIEGMLKAGDIAKKGGISCLVIAAEACIP